MSLLQSMGPPHASAPELQALHTRALLQAMVTLEQPRSSQCFGATPRCCWCNAHHAFGMQAAVGEAGFMTGLERKSDIVNMAAYAPLLVNNNNREWNPDMIVFDNHRWGQP